MSIEKWCEIIDTLATSIECMVSIVFVSTFMGGKFSKKQYRIAAIAGVIQFFFISIYDIFSIFSVGKTIFSQLILLVALFFIYKRDYGRIILLELLNTMIIMLTESISTSILVYISNISFKEILVNSRYRIYLILLGTAVKIIYICMLKLFFRNIRTLKRKSAILMFLFSVGILIFGMYMFKKCSEIDSISTSEIAVFIVLAIMEILIIFSVTMLDDNYNKSEELSLAELHSEMLKQSLDEEKQNFEMWRTHVHDYKNQVIYMRELLETKEYHKLMMSMDKEIGVLRQQLLFVETGYTGIDAIVNTKISVAQAKGIHIICDIKLKVGLSMNDIVISSILGNLLDNAIRAAFSAEEKYVELRINSVWEMLQITVINFSAEKKIDFSKSSKSEKSIHGMGLRSVRNNVRDLDGTFKIEQIGNKVQAVVTVRI